VHALDLSHELESSVLDDLAMSEHSTKGRFIRFVGWLREDGVFRLERGWETPKITEVPRPNGEYRLELIDANQQAIIAVVPQVDSADCRAIGGRMKTLRVLGYLPWDPSGVAVRFRRGDRIIELRALASTVPDVTWDNARIAEGTLQLRWAARHSSPVTFAVGIVKGAQGVKVVDYLDATHAAISIEHIPLEGECRAVVLATDGLRSATASSAPFVLPPKAPIIVISRPRRRCFLRIGRRAAARPRDDRGWSDAAR
jgi:hypothetical protein